MSLYGSEISIVSLGCSCQTARQIDDNIDIIASLFGAGSLPAKGGSYFDSLITPIETIIRFMEAGIPALPASLSLTNDVGPYWPDAGLWFFHYFKAADGSLDASGGHSDHQKVSYLREKFHAIATPTLFVLSNTQNNLDLFHRQQSFADMFGFTHDRLRRLTQALEIRFGQNFAGLVVVENDKTALSGHPLPKVARCLIPLDDTEWKGSPSAWAQVFGTSVRALLPKPLITIGDSRAS